MNNTVMEMLNKAAQRTANKKHVDAKDLAMREIFPVLKAFLIQQEQQNANIEANFSDIYATLQIANEANFLDFTVGYFSELAAFNDQLLVALGWYTPNEEQEGTYKVSPTMPPEVQEQVEAFLMKGAHWYQLFEVVQAAAEFDDDEDDEDDEYEDEDLEVSAEGDPVTDEAPAEEIEPLPVTQEVEIPVEGGTNA